MTAPPQPLPCPKALLDDAWSAWRARGDRGALERLAASALPDLYRLAYRLTGNAADAEDVAQSAFLDLLRADSKSVRSLHAWLCTAATRTARDLLRRRQTRARHEVPGLEDTVMTTATARAESPESLVELRETRDAVHAALAELPGDLREPLVLHFMEALPRAEVAAILELPESTLRLRLQNGLEKLRVLLARRELSLPAVGLPPLLGALSGPEFPARLVAKTVQSAAGAGAAGTTAAAKAAGFGWTAKAVLFAALAAGGSAVLMLTGGNNPTPSAEQGKPPAEEKPKPAPEKSASTTSGADAELAERLQTKIDLHFRDAHLSQVLDEIDYQVRLRSVMPGPIQTTNGITLDAEGIPAVEAIQRIAQQTGLRPEYHGDTLVLWQDADDGILKTLEGKLASNDLQARCEAAYDLAQLADPRIYPLLFKALDDADPAVRFWAEGTCTASHSLTLRYGKGASELASVLLKRLEAVRTAPAQFNAYLKPAWLLAETGDDRAVAAFEAVVDATPPELGLQSVLLHMIGSVRCSKAVESLRRFAGSENREVRALALSCLGSCRSREANDVLLELFTKADGAAAGDVARGLEFDRDPRTADRLLELLKTPDCPRNLAYTASRYRHPRLLEALKSHLAAPTKHDTYSENILAAVYRSDPNWAGARIMERLRSSNPQVRLDMIRVFLSARIRDQKLTAALLDAAKQAEGPYANGFYYGLSTMRLPQVTDFLLHGIESANPDTCQKALFALGGHLDERVEAALWKVVRDKPGSADAITARTVLTCSDRPETLDALHKELASDLALLETVLAHTDRWNLTKPTSRASFYMRLLADANPQTAAAALKATATLQVIPRGLFSAEKARKALRAALEGGDPAMVEQALSVLRKLAADLHPFCVPALLRILHGGTAGQKTAVVHLLGLVRDPRALPLLAAALKDSDAQVRAEAVRSVASYPAMGGQIALAKLVEDPDIQVREAAASFLVYEEDPKYTALFLEMIRKGSPNIQGSAYLYLKRMLDAGKAPDAGKVRAAVDAFDQARRDRLREEGESKPVAPPAPTQEEF